MARGDQDAGRPVGGREMGQSLERFLVLARDEERAYAARIEQALQSLHPRYGQALRLRIVEERSREDCARELGVSVPTFDVVLLRALRAFRRTFEEVSE